MSSALIFGIILLVIGLFLFVYKSGYKIGMVFFLYSFIIGVLAGIASIYFSDNMKIVFSALLISVAFLLNYPPSKKFLIDKFKREE